MGDTSSPNRCSWPLCRGALAIFYLVDTAIKCRSQIAFIMRPVGPPPVRRDELQRSHLADKQMHASRLTQKDIFFFQDNHQPAQLLSPWQQQSKGVRAIGPAYQLPINTNANVTFSIEVKLWMGFKFNSWRSWHLFFQLIRACSSHSECSVG